MRAYRYWLYSLLGGAAICVLMIVSYQYVFVKNDPESKSYPDNFSEEAKIISQKVNAQGQDHGDLEGMEPEDPREVVALMIEYLNRPEPEVRLEAVQTLCDLRFAAYAQPAIPSLEKALNDPVQDIRDFAKLAIQRIRFSEKRK